MTPESSSRRTRSSVARGDRATVSASFWMVERPSRCSAARILTSMRSSAGGRLAGMNVSEVNPALGRCSSAFVVAVLAISRTVDDGNHDDLILVLVNLVHDDVGSFDELVHAFIATRTPHIGELRR